MEGNPNPNQPDNELKYNRSKQPEHGARDKNKRLLEPYLASEELEDAVNLAIKLQKPLLIKGEPGCGKTRLARHIAWQFGLLDKFYFPWYIKSTSRARDGLYTYDAVGRLRDAQLDAANRLDPKIKEKIEKNSYYYLHWGQLGQAFRASKRSVVLIDEIDKADIDFPNDLLLELDEMRFTIDELEGKEITARHPPIVIITSNDEKDLPDAFLRRCLFHYIKFPLPEDLINIVNHHFPNSPEKLVTAIVNRFWDLRVEMEKGTSAKKVSTSELLDWFKVLTHYPKDDDLQKLATELLYPGVLLKNWDDYKHYTELMKKTTAKPEKT